MQLGLPKFSGFVYTHPITMILELFFLFSPLSTALPHIGETVTLCTTNICTNQSLSPCLLWKWWNTIPYFIIGLGLLTAILGYQFRGNKVSSHKLLGIFSLCFILWTVLLFIIGFIQESCPIHGTGQVFTFLTWALVLFYLILGTTYRLSHLGLFSGILIAIFSCIAGFSGIEIYQGIHKPWLDIHISFAILSYASFSLGAIASSAFLVQDWHLKHHKLTGLFTELPSLVLLSKVTPRLVFLGMCLLLISIISLGGVEMLAPSLKLILASITFCGYTLLWTMHYVRGIPPRLFSLLNIGGFILSLTVIFASK